MRHLVFSIIVLSFALFSACDTSDLDCTRASSTIVTVEREHRDFRGIVINEVGDAVLTQGPEYSIKLTGPDNVVALTESLVDGEILIIGGSNCYNGDYNFKVEITAPEIQYVAHTGIGQIETNGPLETDVIQFEVFGISEIEAEVIADTLYTTVSGKVDILYAGEVGYHQINTTGEHEIDAYPLDTQSTLILLEGQGDTYVTAFNLLEVKITGTGDVHYLGEPLIISDITGTGQIIDAN